MRYTISLEILDVGTVDVLRLSQPLINVNGGSSALQFNHCRCPALTAFLGVVTD